MEPLVKNAKSCSLCEGAVDRYQNHFECQTCHAIGDLNTGIMTIHDIRWYEKHFKSVEDWIDFLDLPSAV